MHIPESMRQGRYDMKGKYEYRNISTSLGDLRLLKDQGKAQYIGNDIIN